MLDLAVAITGGFAVASVLCWAFVVMVGGPRLVRYILRRRERRLLNAHRRRTVAM